MSDRLPDRRAFDCPAVRSLPTLALMGLVALLGGVDAVLVVVAWDLSPLVTSLILSVLLAAALMATDGERRPISVRLINTLVPTLFSFVFWLVAPALSSLPVSKAAMLFTGCECLAFSLVFVKATTLDREQRRRLRDGSAIVLAAMLAGWVFWAGVERWHISRFVAALVFSTVLDGVVTAARRQPCSLRSGLGRALAPALFSLVFWLAATGDGAAAATDRRLFSIVLVVILNLGDRQRRLLEALFLIILGFGAASQIKGGLDDHAFLAEQAARRAEDGLPVKPVPGKYQCVLDYDNHFLTTRTFRTTGNQTVSVGLAAMGMTMIIISGGIDLSVGSVMALTSVMTAWCLQRGSAPVPALLAGVFLGALCGLANATMITRLKVVPFIATLGMWGIARGLAKGIAGSQKIDAPGYWLGTHVLVSHPEPPWLLISPGMWTVIVLAMAVWAILRYTSLGRYIFAIGSNEATARLCGIRVERVKLYLYSIAGICTGMAGVMQFCRLNVGDPTTAMGAELDVIAAVVIGGGSLSGGEGSVFGSVIGAVIMAILRAGCTHVHVPSWVQEMIIGAVIVLAVAIDYMRRKSTA